MIVQFSHCSQTQSKLQNHECLAVLLHSVPVWLLTAISSNLLSSVLSRILWAVFVYVLFAMATLCLIVLCFLGHFGLVVSSSTVDSSYSRFISHPELSKMRRSTAYCWTLAWLPRHSTSPVGDLWHYWTASSVDSLIVPGQVGRTGKARRTLWHLGAHAIIIINNSISSSSSSWCNWCCDAVFVCDCGSVRMTSTRWQGRGSFCRFHWRSWKVICRSELHAVCAVIIWSSIHCVSVKMRQLWQAVVSTSAE